MKFQHVVILVASLVAIAGCSKGKETKWGTFNEPVESQPLPESAGAKELSVVWKSGIGKAGDRGYAILRPAVSEQGVFVVNRKGKVSLLDASTGKSLWSKALGKRTFAGVGVGAGVATVAFDNGTLVALDVADGSERWRSPIKRQISAIPAAGSGRVVVRTADGLLIGLDAANGNRVWELNRPVPGLSLHGDSQPLISADAVITGLSNGRILVNSVVTGRDFWEKDVSTGGGVNELEAITDVDATPTLDGNNLYAATYQGDIVSLNLQDGLEQWQFKASSRLPMFVDNNQLLLTDELGKVLSLDATGGFLNWEQTAFQGRGISNPVIVGDRVLVGDASGKIHLLDIADGTLLQSLSVGRSAIVSLQILDSRVLAFSANGTTAVLSL